MSSVSKDAIFDSASFPCSPFTLSQCNLLRVQSNSDVRCDTYDGGQSVSLILFSTSTALEHYYYFACATSCGVSFYYSKTFKISVLACITPTIVTANLASSYQFYVQSSFAQVNVLPSNYLNSVGANCTVDYTLYFVNGTKWTYSSPLSLASSTGVLSITGNTEFDFTVKIVISSTQFTTAST